MRSKRLLGILLFVCIFLSCSLFNSVVFAAEGEYKLTVSSSAEAAGSFEVKIDGVEAMENEGFSIKKGTRVTVKAIAAQGYSFDYWVISGVPAKSSDLICS